MKAYFKSASYPTMFWPSISPDLSPIELMWKILKDELKKRIITSLEQFVVIAKNIWAAIP
jgi:transposase